MDLITKESGRDAALTPSTVKRRVMKKRSGRWPMQHLVAMRKNCSWAICRTDLGEQEDP